ncbi:MAG: hypothetical protein AMXMBFR64_11830 [Myxococcales bacterium]
MIAAAVAVNVAIWWGLNRPRVVRPFEGDIAGVSYAPYREGQEPGNDPTLGQIEEDMALLAGRVGAVRTYGSTGVLGEIPRIAARHGLRVAAGAWVGWDAEANERELEGLIRLASAPNVDRLLIGNEAVLREEASVDQIRAAMRRARAETGKPVSTAEPWDIWLQNPTLAEDADFIAAHVLPYWERIPEERALEHVLARHADLRRAFPGKPIVLTEVGWPSEGKAQHDADPGVANQAAFLRRFLSVAASQGLDYYVMEAFDQPWKRSLEGGVGAYWGIWDADREPKFEWTGVVLNVADWRELCLLSSLLGLAVMLTFARRNGHLEPAGLSVMLGAIQLGATLVTWTGHIASQHYLTPLMTVTWSALFLAQALVIALLLVDTFEISELVWARSLRRQFFPVLRSHAGHQPKVSIHLAIANEPSEMVAMTLRSLAELDYPDYEVIVVDNNTKDEAVWRPVQSLCAQLGSRFTFVHIPHCPGFKAEALNRALSLTHPDARVVGVVDSDYVLRRDWLSALVPHFARDEIALVQAPQDHRAWEGDSFKEMTNWEYAGFFHIGMVHRNERDAIIQHGTMCLVRRSALEQVGGWAEWCICEDAELGLRLLEAGYSSAYVEESFGHGLTPDTFTAYKKQRYRWAFGAFQILRRYGWALLTGRGTRLGMAQRYHFIAGWLPWLAEGLSVLFTAGALLWTAGMVLWPHLFELPPLVFVVPSLGLFTFKVVQALLLYGTRVRCSWRQRLGAALAGLSLTHAVGRAVLRSLAGRRLAFFRTPKLEGRPAALAGFLMARGELALMLLLWLGATVSLARLGTSLSEGGLWAMVLLAWSTPYAAAVAVSLVNAGAGDRSDGPRPSVRPAIRRTLARLGARAGRIVSWGVGAGRGVRPR